MRPGRARFAGQRGVCRQTVVDAAQMRHHRAERRMKRHGGTTVHRHRRRRTGHHIMIAATVVGILVADRADDGHLVERLGQSRHSLAELNTRHRGWDGIKFTAHIGRGIRLRVEHLIMRRATVEPDEDAVHLIRACLADGPGRFGPQSNQVAHAQAKNAPDAELDEIPARYSRTVCVERIHFRFSD